jgi:hypothetical protein
VVGDGRSLVTVMADEARVTLLGALVLKRRGSPVAYFRRGQWGTWWERHVIERGQVPSELERGALDVDMTYRGPLEPKPRPFLP